MPATSVVMFDMLSIVLSILLSSSLLFVSSISLFQHISSSSVMPLSIFLGSLLLSLCEVTLTLYSSYVGVYLLTFLTSAQGNDSSFSA